MNKYYVKIPYSYTQYADLTGFVFAESSEEAEELAADDWNIHDQEHNDNDSSGDSEFDYDTISVQLEESDIDVHEIPSRNNSNTFTPAQTDLPNYYLEDLQALATL